MPRLDAGCRSVEFSLLHSGAEFGKGRQPVAVGLAAGHGVVVVLPTYNERENLEAIVAHAILDALPDAHLLVVDDNSPDGTGALADALAAAEPRVSVLHRPAKEGLGVAYRDAFRWALDRPETDAGGADGRRFQPRPA